MEYLKTLRDFTVGKISVEEADDVFEFSNGQTIKGDTKTIYKRKNQQQFYNFNELYHYIKVAHIEKKTSKYVARKSSPLHFAEKYAQFWEKQIQHGYTGR